jgi:hypothetical protein
MITAPLAGNIRDIQTPELAKVMFQFAEPTSHNGCNSCLSRSGESAYICKTSLIANLFPTDEPLAQAHDFAEGIKSLPKVFKEVAGYLNRKGTS